MPSSFTTRQVGAANSFEYRLFLQDESTSRIVSPFHDVPLYVDKAAGIVNMFVEIPRWSNAKLEICKEELMNPVKQDIKKGALRYVKNIFPHRGYPWNYGALPQTWECPDVLDRETGLRGDNDPIDALEIGSDILPSGSVRQVRVLGASGLIDEGETDWKIVVVDVRDPLAEKLHDIEDVRAHCPGLLEATHKWYQNYKVPDGKGKNSFAFNGEYKDKNFAMKIIAETHELWHKLITGNIDNKRDISLCNRIEGNPNMLADDSKLPEMCDSIPDPRPVDPSAHKQLFID